MASKIETAYDAWWFLQDHPAFFHPEYPEDSLGMGLFKQDCLDVDIQMVCPESLHIETDTSRNTHQRVWLEAGPYVADEWGEVVTSHDWRLDCGGDTFEEAVVKLSQLVIKHYGDYRNE